MKEIVLAYIYDNEGKHSNRIQLKKDPEIIASFLVRTANAYKVVMTDIFDLMFLETLPKSGGFLARCDQSFLPSLLEHLVPMQQGEVDPPEIDTEEWGNDSLYITGDEVKEWLNTKFKTNL